MFAAPCGTWHELSNMSCLCRDCLNLAPALAEACPACHGGRLVQHPALLHLTIAHIDCDAFYASVEKRDRPELADEPVIVGHPGGRGVVTTATYAARDYGVHSGMGLMKAAVHSTVLKLISRSRML